MRKLFILILLFVPLWISPKEKTSLPMEMYAQWNDGTVKIHDIFMNFSKTRRDEIVDSINAANYDRWVEQKYNKNKFLTIKLLLQWQL